MSAARSTAFGREQYSAYSPSVSYITTYTLPCLSTIISKYFDIVGIADQYGSARILRSVVRLRYGQTHERRKDILYRRTIDDRAVDTFRSQFIYVIELRAERDLIAAPAEQRAQRRSQYDRKRA